MNFPYFVAKKIAFSEGSSFSKVIVRIAIASVAMSLMVMILALSSINGFKKEITSKMFGFWGHIDVKNNTLRSNYEPISIDLDDEYVQHIGEISDLTYAPVVTYLSEDGPQIEEYTSFGGVKHIQPYVMYPGILFTSDEVEGLLLKGLNEDYYHDNFKKFLIKGELIDFSNKEGSKDIIISEQTANRMKLDVGDKTIINFLHESDPIKRAFKIKGIYKTGLEEYDRRYAIVDMKRIQQILRWEDNQVMGLDVYLDDQRDLDLISNYMYNEVLPSHITNETISRKHSGIFQWLELQNINLRVILSLVLVVALINMVTAILILILERRTMIAILKSLGARNWSIRKIFVYQAAYIVGLGLVIGNILGIGLALVQKYFGVIKLDEKNYYLSVAPIEMDWLGILGANLICAVTIVGFLILPTILVTRIMPVKTLRFG